MELKNTDQPVTKPEKKGAGVTAFLIVLVVITVTVLICKIVGVKLYAVTSPSMEPALAVGEVVMTAPFKFENLKENDIITFYINQNLQTATHRITAINKDAQTFMTKGDNNDNADGSPVLYGNVVGKVVVSVPFIGYALVYLTTLQGKLTIGALLLIFVILLFLWDDGSKKEKQSQIIQNDDVHRNND